MADRVAPLRADALRLFHAAVAAVSPATVLPAHLPPPPAGRIAIFAGGKAGASLAAAAERHYLALGVEPERLFGLAVTRHGYGCETRVVPVREAGHPVPDESSLAASADILRLAREVREDDLALVLISGGASANWVAPAPGVSFAEKRALNAALLKSGAPINALNTVRKHLSRIKGGRLAQALGGAGSLVTLAISDVPGDLPTVIGSGPTVPDPTTLADARAVLARYGVAVPPSIAAALDDPANETPKPGAPEFAASRFSVIARPADALAAAVQAAARLGYRVHDLGPDVEGDARATAGAHAAMALALQGKGGRMAILSGGELTVEVRGKGRGGPNQEYALAIAVALAGRPGIAGLSGDTDGTDGGGGDPSDPAGAFFDETTLSRAAALGMDPEAYLDDNDSTGFFRPLADCLMPGPTLTNANDLRVILIDG